MAFVVDSGHDRPPSGSNLAEEISPACAKSSSDGGWPRRSSSARERWIVVSPTALSAMPASQIRPPSTQTAADAAAIAQSPARRSTFSCALPPPARSGTLTSVSSPRRRRPSCRGRRGTRPSRPFARRSAADHDRRLDRGTDGGEILGCVGLAERAADRAAVADDRIGDHGLGVAEDREVPRQELGLEELDVACQRADPDLTVLFADIGELRRGR